MVNDTDEPTWLRTLAPAEPTDVERITQEAVRELAERWAPIIDAFGRAWAETARKLAQAMAPELERVHQQLVDAGVMPEPLPDDPAERALYLRRHHNTGPPVHADPRRNRR